MSVVSGYLDVGESLQVTVFFKPPRAGYYSQDLLLQFNGGKVNSKIIKLVGGGRNVDVKFSTRLLNMEDTYLGLKTRGTLLITNNSDVPVDFSFRFSFSHLC